jgi:hypothetical protein
VSSRRRRRWQTLGVLGLIGLQVLVGGTGLGWFILTRPDGGLGTAARLDPAPPAGVPLTIENGFPGAEALARRWSADARLFSVSMQIEWPADGGEATTDIPATGWIIYTFAAARPGPGAGARAATLSIMVDRQSAIVVGQEVVGWTTVPERTISPTAYPVGSWVALLATELTGGSAYRSACPAFRRLSRVGLATTNRSDNPHWVVTYEDWRNLSQPGVLVRVDALTGQVEHIRSGEEPCP